MTSTSLARTAIEATARRGERRAAHTDDAHALQAVTATARARANGGSATRAPNARNAKRWFVVLRLD